MRLHSRRRRWRSYRAGLSDEHQAGDDDEGANRAGDAVTRGSEAFNGDGGGDDRHRAQVHDANRQQDHRRAGGAAAAVQAEAQAVPPGGAGIGGQRAARRRLVATAREVMGLPGGELQRAGDQHDHAHRDRHGARHRLLLHFNPRQHDASRERRDAQHDPDEEVPAADDRGKPAEASRACALNSFAIAPQHRDERRQHHRHHHHQPHPDKRHPQPGPGLSRHSHPRHRHRPATRHFHAAHRRHRRAPDCCQRRAREEEQR